jgi:hypothetical protein
MMQIDLQYVLGAIKAMNEAADAIRSGTPEQRGRAAAECIVAAIDLEVRIGRAPIDVSGAAISQPVGGVQ